MPESAPPDAAPRADRESLAALARHRTRQRPRRIAYAAAITVVALVLLVIVKIAYSHGEISHATLDTIPSSSVPRTIAPATPTATPVRAWSSSDPTALGVPYYGGTVVTFDKHTVRGRDARTGKQTWSYTRTDRTVCTAMQASGVTVAVFELDGNCDELTALATDTGDRRWTRTLDKDSNRFDHGINGVPHFIVTPFTVVFWTPQVIYAIDPSGDQYRGNKQAGLDRWVFAHQGCTIEDVALGTNGALVSQNCVGQDCNGAKFCGNGQQLLLRDQFKGEDTNSETNKNNPDQIKWNLFGSDLRPATADQVVAAISRDGTQLDVLSLDKAKIEHRIALNGGTGAITSYGAGDADLIRFAGVTYALRRDAAAFAWQQQTTGLPTVTSNSGQGTPTLSQAILTVATGTGVATLDPSDGKATHSFDLEQPANGGLAYPLGSGFLIAGAATVYYR